MRVVSLVPSITETLLAWGLTPIAVTRFCEQPDLPAVGGTKNPDLAAIAELKPDLVVMDTEENRDVDAAALTDAGLVVHASSVRSVADVGPALDALAISIGAPKPDPLVVPLDGPLSAPPPESAGRRAFIPIWRRPWMTINDDTYGASVLRLVGVSNVFGDAAERYRTVEIAEVSALHPEVALVPTEPYDFTAVHRDELAAELACPAIEVDGKDLFWWGVRTPGAISRLAAAVHR